MTNKFQFRLFSYSDIFLNSAGTKEKIQEQHLYKILHWQNLIPLSKLLQTFASDKRSFRQLCFLLVQVGMMSIRKALFVTAAYAAPSRLLPIMSEKCGSIEVRLKRIANNL